MGPILLGVAALGVILLILRGLAYADTKLLLRILRYSGAGGLGLFTVLLALTGRMGPALFLGSMAWGLATGGHVWPRGWPHYSRGSSRPRASSGGKSSVRAAWVEMELDHDTGEMQGTVLRGAHAGKPLDRLNQDDLTDLYFEASADDAESGRLLEAWLDRVIGPDWRNDARERESGNSSQGPMSRDEALKILGLHDGAGDEEIRAVHRRLMLQNHPDRGGSDYLAAKINEARDTLLGA
ncbi:MAG TPA: hypothetical protein VFW28_04610 [Micropepsaceae bacterium]|nr:hypothetical protein [Micropepsaceae bacterium]